MARLVLSKASSIDSVDMHTWAKFDQNIPCGSIVRLSHLLWFPRAKAISFGIPIMRQWISLFVLVKQTKTKAGIKNSSMPSNHVYVHV